MCTPLPIHPPVNTLEALNRQYQVASTDPMPAAATEPSAAPASVVPVSTAPLPSTMPTAAGAVPELPAEDLERARASMVPADPRRSTCSICGESFERTYDDVHDQWVYRFVLAPPSHATLLILTATVQRQQRRDGDARPHLRAHAVLAALAALMRASKHTHTAEFRIGVKKVIVKEGCGKHETRR